MKDTDILQKFGSRIRELRKDKGLSQEQLAELTGFHRTYIGMVERGERNPALINIEIFAMAFEVSLAELLSFEENMKIRDVFTKLPNFYNIRFGELKQDERLKSKINFDNAKINKGLIGQMLELLLGLQLTTKNLDFEDGELKTNKAKANGDPMETMAITQIGTQFDNLFYKGENFTETHLYEKIESLLYLPVVKQDRADDWYFLPAHYINLQENRALKQILETDFETIKTKVHELMDDQNDGMLHTVNGEYIQIRTKDSKPYSPIFSEHLNRYVSNKGFAFYFKKEFMKAIQNEDIPSQKIV